MSDDKAVSVPGDRSIVRAIEDFYSELWDRPVASVDSLINAGSVLGIGGLDGVEVLNTGDSIPWHVDNEGNAWFEDITADEEIDTISWG
jgi:hypothetical protein